MFNWLHSSQLEQGRKCGVQYARTLSEEDFGIYQLEQDGGIDGRIGLGLLSIELIF